jgi:hypothetical protein
VEKKQHAFLREPCLEQTNSERSSKPKCYVLEMEVRPFEEIVVSTATAQTALLHTNLPEGRQ